MAESIPNSDNTMQDQGRLKYLEFVHVAASTLLMYAIGVYDFAKDNSGPLKPGVQTVEATVKSVVGPVYEKLHDVPFEILKFVDHKVDDAAQQLDKHVPSVVREACGTAQKVPEVARSVAGEVKRAGVVGTAAGAAKAAYETCSPVARDLYDQYEPVAEHYAVSAWRSLNKLPLFPQTAQIVVPTAAYWSEKYNKVVGLAVERGFRVAEYVPLVPMERIAKVFGSDADAMGSEEASDVAARELQSKEVHAKELHSKEVHAKEVEVEGCD